MLLVLIEGFGRFHEEVTDRTRNTIFVTGLIDVIIVVFFSIEMPLVLFQIYQQVKTLSNQKIPDNQS